MSNKLIWYSQNAIGGSEEFNYKDGIVFIDNLSEELDSMTVVLHAISKTNFEPFDKVVIKNDNFTDLNYINPDDWTSTTTDKYMLIDNIIENIVSFNNSQNNNILYDYTITLMSYTKLLERTVLPDISITKRASGTQLTCWEEIIRLLIDYSPKRLFNINNEKDFRRMLYTYVGEPNSQLLRTTPCPEFQMSKPTLREAIDKVMSACYSICKLQPYLGIGVVDINKRNNPINLNDNTQTNYVGDLMAYINESQQSTEYASGLDNNYTNITANKASGIHNNVSVFEYKGFRTTGDVLINDNNMTLLTNKPIYDIKSLTISGMMQLYTGATAFENVYFKKDIIDKIYEKQEYDSLRYDDTKKALYFTRGSNNINGFSQTTGWWLSERTAIENIIREIGQEIATSKGWTFNHTAFLRNYTFFEIEYYALDTNTRAITNKYLPETNEDNIITDNPTEAFSDIKLQGLLFSQKCNRLGNRVKVLTGRFPISKKQYIPQLGDYLNNYVVINRELQYYDNFINVKISLSENFVNINYFTGINARRRTWSVASQNESFNKQLLDKWYCEFSFNEKKNAKDQEKMNTSWYGDNNRYLSELLINSFDYDNLSYIKYAFVTKNNNSDNNYIQLETSSYISGNSLLIHCEFTNNKASEFAVNTYSWVVGGTAQTKAVYTQTNNERDSWVISLLNNNYSPCWDRDTSILTNGTVIATGSAEQNLLLHIKQISDYYPTTTLWYLNDLDNNPIKNYGIYVSGKKGPVVSLSPTMESDLINHKDNREIPQFNFQFEFCSDTSDIIIGRKFLERNKLISTITHDGDYKIYVSPEKYKYGDETLKDNSTLCPDSEITITSSRQETAKLSAFGILGLNHKSIAITDNNDNLILAINTTTSGNIDNLVYLNLLRTRDRKLYTNINMLSWQ